MFIKTQTVPKTSKYFSVLVVDSLYTNLRSMPFPLANINFENDNMRIFLILHLKKPQHMPIMCPDNGKENRILLSTLSCKFSLHERER